MRKEGIEENMKYQIMRLNTVWNKDPKLGGLSFVESERDIPFAIKRIYCIYKTEENQHRGLQAYKKNWQLLFCPYGVIDIILTDGEQTETITLDNPSKGLVLNPGLWQEMIWRHDDSVLCVAASEYCDPDEYIRNYDEYLSYRKAQNEDEKSIGGYCTSEVGNVLDVKMLKFPCAFPSNASCDSSDTVSRSIVVEGMKDIPFEIRRIFYIFGEGNIGLVRGKHANRKSEFVLFNISGKSKVKVIDEDLGETVYELNEPRDAVYLPRMIWKEMYDFTSDSVLMVVTNEYYDATEYVRDFEMFAEEVREMKRILEMN
nr:FdtA/QdtA family cupin domain-containing protein [uncultured Marvinbryantia sp.]